MATDILSGGQGTRAGNPIFVAPGDAAAAGTAWSAHRDTDADNSSQAIKTSAGVLGGLVVTNINAEDCWLHLYDAANVSGTPLFSVLVPKGDGTARGVAAMDWGEAGLSFATAIRYNAVATDDGADPSNGLELNAWYK